MIIIIIITIVVSPQTYNDNVYSDTDTSYNSIPMISISDTVS